MQRKNHPAKFFYRLLLVIPVVFLGQLTFAQNGSVGIGTRTPDSSAMLDVYSSTKGLLLPRVHITDTASASPVSNPADGLLVLNSTFTVGDKTHGKGIYYWSKDLNKWLFILSAGAAMDIDMNKVYDSLKRRTDSLTADGYIDVTGGDSSVLNRVRLALNLKAVSDSLFKQTYFTDSLALVLVNNTVLQDSIASVVRSTTAKWYSNNSVLADSIYNTVLSKADSLTARNHITVNGGSGSDSAVLKAIVLDLDMLGLARDTAFNHALARDSSFIAALAGQQQFKDSVASIVNNSSSVKDSVRNSLKQLYGNIRTVNASTTIQADDFTLIVRKLTTDATVTLPAAETCKGRLLNITYLYSTSDPSQNKRVFFDKFVWYTDDYKTKELESAGYSNTGGSLKITIQSTGLPESDPNGGWIVLNAMY